MNLIRYLNKYVKITLKNDYYYKGKVVEADENSLTLLDIKKKDVGIDESEIKLIQAIDESIN